MPAASRDEITSILGNLDFDELLAIVELQPSTTELEEAVMWMSGDRDVFGATEPLKGTASKIVTILTADEEEEPGG
jgi:hypothetical protein